MKKVLFFLLAFTSSAFGQYTQMQWGMNKTISPYAFGANLNGTWSNLGTVTPGGVWTLVASNLPASLTSYPGVDPTGATYSDAGFALWLADLKAKKQQGFVPSGYYKFQNRTIFDLTNATAFGLNIVGEGCNKSVFVSEAASGPAFVFDTETLSYSGDVTFTTNPTNGSTFTLGGATLTFVSTTPVGNQVLIGANTAATLENMRVFLSTTSDPAFAQFNYSVVSLTLYLSGKNPGNGAGFSMSTTVSGATVRTPTLESRGDSFYTAVSGISFSSSVNGPTLQFGRDDMKDPLNAPNVDVCVNNAGTGGGSESVRVNSVVASPYFHVVTANNQAGVAWNLRGAAFSHFLGTAGSSDIGVKLTCTPAQACFSNILEISDMEVVLKPLVIDNSGGAAPNKNTILLGQVEYSIRGGPCAIDATAGSENLIIGGNLGSVTDFCNSVGVQALNANGIRTAATTVWTLQSGLKTYQDAVDSSGASYHTNYTTAVNDNHAVGSGGCFTYFVGSVEVNRVCGNAQTTKIATAFENGINVGVSGSIVGSVSFRNATSGSISLQAVPGALGTVTASLPANTGTIAETNLAQSFSALQTFGAGWGVASMAVSATAPSIGSGFGTTPSIVASNGTAAFQVNVGTGGAASSGTITMPAAANGWSCSAVDVTTPATNFTRQTGSAPNSVTVSNYNAAGALSAWTASDRLNLLCAAF